jgi:hypothetical protein
LGATSAVGPCPSTAGKENRRFEARLECENRKGVICTRAETVVRELVTVEITPAFQIVDRSTQILGPLNDEVSPLTRADP